MNYSLRSLFTVFLLTAFVAATLAIPQAWAIRAVPWLPNAENPIIVKVALGRTTEIVFPAHVGYLTGADEETLQIESREERAYLYPRRRFSWVRLYGLDAAGRSYVFEVHQVEPPEPEDDSVQISVAALEEPQGPEMPGTHPQVVRLLVLMKEGRAVPGYQILDGGGELFLEEVKLSQWRLNKVYLGPRLAGLVVDVENISSQAIRLDPQQLNFKGLRGASITDHRLAPKEPESSLEAFKGYPKRTKAYIVVNRNAFESGKRRKTSVGASGKEGSP